MSNLARAQLYSVIQKALPNWLHDDICLVAGRWYAASKGDPIYPLSDALEHQLHLQPMWKREAQEREQEIAWRKGLSEKTAKEVEAMCRRLLRGNPRNRFVREQYPQLYAVITAEQQAATMHRGKEHAA
ncbi:MAG: hypothetical protein SFW64_00075 [Alphaproteobacteria bacterium]|nr:hypothetical protein [Alphaproteobacteria bacterium]